MRHMSSGSDINYAESIKQILAFIWPADSLSIRARTLAALLLVFVAQGISVGLPILYKIILDAFDAGSASMLVTILVLTYGLGRFASQIVQTLRQYVFVPVTQRALRTKSVQVFQHLLDLSLDFHLDRKTGGLARVLDRGTSGLLFLIELALFQLGPVLLELAIVTAILVSLYDVVYAVAVAATVAAYTAFTAAMADRLTTLRRAANAADVAAGVAMVDGVLNYETVKYFGTEASEVRRVDRARLACEEATVRHERSRMALTIGQGLIISAGSLAMMLIAARQVVAGKMTVGDFVLVNTYLLQLYAPLGALAVIYSSVRQAIVDAETMADILRRTSSVKDAQNAMPLRVSEGTVRFESVGFQFDGRGQLIRDISFEIKAGTSLALVGSSGSGKSTLTKLLFRFYDVNTGVITVDGVDIRTVTQASLRAAIGMVPQETVLFNGTIYENLKFANPHASDADIERAAKQSELHDTIMAMPEGYGTMVGERGLKLSGGEKQRVAIARTLLKDPHILVLDEATSALDNQTERAIQDRLGMLAKGRTTLIVAHRLSTIADADQIIVLDRGNIVERGTHQSLLRKQGLYAAMWHRQVRRKEEAESEPLSPTYTGLDQPAYVRAGQRQQI